VRRSASCTGCQQRDEIIADLRQRLHAAQARIRQLEAQLGRNATNSSVPPSANPPGAPKRWRRRRWFSACGSWTRRGRAWQLAHETGSLPPLEAGRGPHLCYPRPRFRDQLESDALIKYRSSYYSATSTRE
jgi:hypothetical protein